MRRKLWVVCLVVLSMLLIGQTAWAAGELEIGTYAELKAFMDSITSTKDYAGYTVRLTNDIVIGADWRPSGTVTVDNPSGGTYGKVTLDGLNPFKGTFDGQGHTISGLVMDTSFLAPGSAQWLAGLFMSLESATVKNLNIVNVTANANCAAFHLAPLATMVENSTIENVNITGTLASRALSGMVSVAANTTLKNCTSSVNLNVTTINTSNPIVGGLVEQASEIKGKDVMCSFINCAYSGNIFITANSSTTYVWTGGMFGGTSYESPAVYATLIVENCTMGGTIAITPSNPYPSETVSNVYRGTTGAAVATKSQFFNGLLGRVHKDVPVSVRTTAGLFTSAGGSGVGSLTFTTEPVDESSAVAMIGTTSYTSFDDAWTAAIAKTSATIKLLKDATTSTALTVANGKTITINFNGFTLTSSCGGAQAITVNGTILLTGGGELRFNSAVGILNKSPNTVRIGGVDITPANAGSYGVRCENGVVIIEQPTNALIELTNPADRVQVSLANDDEITVDGDGASVLHGRTVTYYGPGALGAALDDAVTGDVVTVEANAQITANVALANDVVIDLNGHTVTTSGATISTAGNNEVVVKNSAAQSGTGANATIPISVGGAPAAPVQPGNQPVVVAAGGNKKLITSFRTNQSSITLYVGGTFAGTATALPADAVPSSVTWSSNNPSVATVSSGTITAIGLGSATITAKVTDTNDPNDLSQLWESTITVSVITPTPSKNQPTITGSNALVGKVSAVGDQTVKVKLANASFGAGIEMTAKISTLSAKATATANGDVSFSFKAADLNKLAIGTYPITVSSASNTANYEATATVGSLVVSAEDPTDPTKVVWSVPDKFTATTGFGYSIVTVSGEGAKMPELAWKVGKSDTVKVSERRDSEGVLVGYAITGTLQPKDEDNSTNVEFTDANGLSKTCTVTVVANRFYRGSPLRIRSKQGVYSSTNTLEYKNGELHVNIFFLNMRKNRSLDKAGNLKLVLYKNGKVVYQRAIQKAWKLSPTLKFKGRAVYQGVLTNKEMGLPDGTVLDLGRSEYQAVLVRPANVTAVLGTESDVLVQKGLVMQELVLDDRE